MELIQDTPGPGRGESIAIWSLDLPLPSNFCAFAGIHIQIHEYAYAPMQSLTCLPYLVFYVLYFVTQLALFDMVVAT